MISIYKNFKIQKFFQNHISDGLNNAEKDAQTSEKVQGAENFSQKIANQTKDKASETIKQKDLLDFFKLPEFNNAEDLIAFIKEVDADVVYYHAEWEYKRPQFEKEFILSANKAIEELRRKEWFEIGENSLPRNVSSLSGFLADYKKIKSASKNNRKIHYDLVLFLKNIKNIYKIIQADFTEVDYKKNYINYTRTEFFEKIANIFTENPDIFREGEFTIHKEDFSKSHYFKVEWMAHIDGRKIPFEAEFGEKSLNRVLSKMNGDAKYGIPEFIRDLHRGRVKVASPQDALFLGKIFQKSLGDFEANVKWNWMKQDDVELYRRQYASDNRPYDLILEYIDIKNKKNISADMQEFRLSRAYHNDENPWFELQFVPKENHNETGFAHHSVYEMKWEIREILENYPRFYEDMLDKIISHFHEKWREKKWNPLELSKEQIKAHIIENLNLVEIFDWPNPSNIKQKAFTSQKNLEKYPTLFGHTDITYVSLRKFLNFFDEKRYWVPQKIYIQICKLYQKIQDISYKIKNISQSIDMEGFSLEKNQEIREYMIEQDEIAKQIRSLLKK